MSPSRRAFPHPATVRPHLRRRYIQWRNHAPDLVGSAGTVRRDRLAAGRAQIRVVALARIVAPRRRQRRQVVVVLGDLVGVRLVTQCRRIRERHVRRGEGRGEGEHGGEGCEQPWQRHALPGNCGHRMWRAVWESAQAGGGRRANGATEGPRRSLSCRAPARGALRLAGGIPGGPAHARWSPCCCWWWFRRTEQRRCSWMRWQQQRPRKILRRSCSRCGSPQNGCTVPCPAWRIYAGTARPPFRRPVP